MLYHFAEMTKYHTFSFEKTDEDEKIVFTLHLCLISPVLSQKRN